MKNVLATCLLFAAVAIPVVYATQPGAAVDAVAKPWHIDDAQLQAMNRDFPLAIPAGSVDRIFASQ